jgi:sulfate transport system permease protein
LPYVSEIVPLLSITKLEQYDMPGATAIALTMLVTHIERLTIPKIMI